MTTHLTRTYNDSGRLTGQTFGNSVSEVNTFNTDGTIASIAGPGGTFAYTYDQNRQLRPPTGEGGRRPKAAASIRESITGLLSASSWTTGSSGFDDDDRLIDRDQGTGTLDEQWSLSVGCH